MVLLVNSAIALLIYRSTARVSTSSYYHTLPPLPTTSRLYSIKEHNRVKCSFGYANTAQGDIWHTVPSLVLSSTIRHTNGDQEHPVVGCHPWAKAARIWKKEQSLTESAVLVKIGNFFDGSNRTKVPGRKERRRDRRVESGSSFLKQRLMV